MINIDADLARAWEAASDWSIEAARATADSLARSAFAKIDWDDGAGEQWLRVLDDHQVVALVSARLPLVIFEGPGTAVSGIPGKITVIHVGDLDGAEIAASEEMLTSVFGSADRFHVLDTEGFSANELWYATV